MNGMVDPGVEGREVAESTCWLCSAPGHAEEDESHFGLSPADSILREDAWRNAKLQ